MFGINDRVWLRSGIAVLPIALWESWLVVKGFPLSPITTGMATDVTPAS
jgi:hypothetical protein